MGLNVNLGYDFYVYQRPPGQARSKLSQNERIFKNRLLLGNAFFASQTDFLRKYQWYPLQEEVFNKAAFFTTAGKKDLTLKAK